MLHVYPWHAYVFGKAPGVVIRLVKGFAGGVMAAQAVAARIAGDMMGDEDPIAHSVTLHTLPDLNDLTRGLVAQHPRGIFDAVPFERITATNTTCYHL